MDNGGLRAANSMERFCSRWICPALIALFCFGGDVADADPVGDFFKKIGQSVSKAFQAQPTPHQNKKARTSRRSTAREANAPELTPTAAEQPPKPAKEERPAPTALPALVAPAEKSKGDLPYGIPLPGQKGIVMSPYLPDGNYIDVSAFAPGRAVKDPYTGKIFLVP